MLSQASNSLLMLGACPVKSSWRLCNASIDGLRTVLFSAVARDRTSLLHLMVAEVYTFSPDWRIAVGYSRTIEDFFSAFLVIRAPKADVPRLGQFLEQIERFANKIPVGLNILVEERISLTLRGQDRNGLLHDVLTLFFNNNINIAAFQISTDINLGNANPLELSDFLKGATFCTLTFELELLEEIVKEKGEILIALSDLGLKGRWD